MFDAFGSRSTLICSDLTGKAVSTPAPAEFGRGTHMRTYISGALL